MIGCNSSVVGCSSNAVGCSSSVVGCSSSVVECSSSVLLTLSRRAIVHQIFCLVNIPMDYQIMF